MLRKLFIAILCLALNSGALAALGQVCEVASCCCDPISAETAYTGADTGSSCCCNDEGEPNCKMGSSRADEKPDEKAAANTSHDTQRAHALVASTKSAVVAPALVVTQRADPARTLPLSNSAFLVQRLLC